ncbi:MAG: hypothetical protein QMB94_02350 [Phycisphaerales bacterium]
MCAAAKISRFAVADVSGHGGAVAKFGAHLPLGVIDGTEYEQFTGPFGPGEFILFGARSRHRSEIGEMLGAMGYKGWWRHLTRATRQHSVARWKPRSGPIWVQCRSKTIDRCW